MRQLFPTAVPDVDVDARYGGPGQVSRPWVMANMVASADGAAAWGGRSGGLGGAADRRLFLRLRALADVVLVAAGTVRAEHYGPVRLAEDQRLQRRAQGRTDVPALAVVSASLDLDWSAALFTAGHPHPYLVTTTGAPAARLERAKRAAEVIVAGEERVDLVAMLAVLRRRGVGLVLCEGGPCLLGQLVAEGVLDELCLTIAPCLLAGNELRIARGPELAEPAELALAHVLEEDGYLFLRYLTAGDRM